MSNVKTAWVFPGQGSQSVGMAAEIYSRNRAARSVYEKADAALGFSLSTLCFKGPEDELTRTVNVQPAILVTGIAMLEAAREAGKGALPAPSCMAGHSLGQYTALVASGALSLEEAVILVRERGRLMYEAGLANPGGMLALIGAEEGVVAEICAASGAEISNLNSPGQIIVSGSLSELETFKLKAGEKGIRRILPLKVSGAFHSKHMRPAAAGLSAAIEKCHFKQPCVPIISNVSVAELRDEDSIKKDLVEQLTACVRWQQSIEKLLKQGIGSFVEIGNGQVISGLIKRIDPNAVIYHAGELITA